MGSSPASRCGPGGQDAARIARRPKRSPLGACVHGGAWEGPYHRTAAWHLCVGRRRGGVGTWAVAYGGCGVVGGRGAGGGDEAARAVGFTGELPDRYPLVRESALHDG